MRYMCEEMIVDASIFPCINIVAQATSRLTISAKTEAISAHIYEFSRVPQLRRTRTLLTSRITIENIRILFNNNIIREKSNIYDKQL